MISHRNPCCAFKVSHLIAQDKVSHLIAHDKVSHLIAQDIGKKLDPNSIILKTGSELDLN